MGGAHWRDDFSQVLLGCNVVVIADKDNSGRKHAQTVAQSLHGYAASIRVLELPDVGGTQVKDAADWISAGGTLAQLDEIISATPAWTPDSSGSTSAGLGCVTNSTHSTNPTNQPITLSNESQDESYLCYLLQLGPLLDRTIPAVRITNPFRELFHLVENLKHWEATHRPATEDEVTGLFNEWFRQSQPFLVETFGSDECRFEFNKVLKRWDPEKRVFRQAWVASEGDPPPPQALKFKDIRIHRLAAFARKLQAQLGDKPLFLSGKVVQKLFGLADRIQGWRWLRMLEGVGVLRLTQSGNTHACNQYRYALPLGLDSNCETILEPPTSRIPIPAPAPDTGVHLAPADQELLIRHQI
jgi:hypothetical protein